MANRKATFAKRQRETDLKDRAKQKDERRSQKRGEVRDVKGPQIAWDEAVYATTSSDELPSLDNANQAQAPAADDSAEAAEGPTASGPPAGAAPNAPPNAAPAGRTASAPISGTAAKPTTPSPSPTAPRRVG
jgi:hypothetical protein